MKILIWVLTILVGTVINVTVGQLTGIQSGAFLLYIAEAFVAKLLCDKWNEHIKAKQGETGEKPMPELCPRCGFKLLEGSEFCSHCGNKLK